MDIDKGTTVQVRLRGLKENVLPAVAKLQESMERYKREHRVVMADPTTIPSLIGTGGSKIQKLQVGKWSGVGVCVWGWGGGGACFGVPSHRRAGVQSAARSLNRPVLCGWDHVLMVTGGHGHQHRCQQQDGLDSSAWVGGGHRCRAGRHHGGVRAGQEVGGDPPGPPCRGGVCGQGWCQH